jgi:hypothetical protein
MITSPYPDPPILEPDMELLVAALNRGGRFSRRWVPSGQGNAVAFGQLLDQAND